MDARLLEIGEALEINMLPYTGSDSPFMEDLLYREILDTCRTVLVELDELEPQESGNPRPGTCDGCETNLIGSLVYCANCYEEAGEEVKCGRCGNELPEAFCAACAKPETEGGEV